MKLLLIMAAMLSLMPPLQAQQSAAGKASTNNTELRQRAEDWKDAGMLAEFYTDDAEYVSPHVPGLMIRGREKIKENFKRGVTMGGRIDTVIVLTSGSSFYLGYMVCKY